MKTLRGYVVFGVSNLVGIGLIILVIITSRMLGSPAGMVSWERTILLVGVSALILIGINGSLLGYSVFRPLMILLRLFNAPERDAPPVLSAGIRLYEIASLEQAIRAHHHRTEDIVRASRKFLEQGSLPTGPLVSDPDPLVAAMLQFMQMLQLINAYIEALIQGHLYVAVPDGLRNTQLGHLLGVMTTELRTIITEIRQETRQLSMSSAKFAAMSQQGSRNATTETHAIENISSSIHQVAGNLREVMQNITRQSGSLEETFADIQDLLISTEHINSSVELLSASAEATARSIDGIHEFMQEIDRHAHSLAGISETISAEAKDGGKAVEKVIAGIHTIKQTVENAATAIRHLGEESQHIGEIVEVINDVAEQTNLLALNASIIAAQAGEHGRGFSVVADEIKDLANRTRSSTQEIGKIIRSLQTGVEHGTVAMKQCLAAVSDGVELANQSGAILQKIVQSIQGAKEMATTLAEATVTQTQNSQQVHYATEQITQKIGELYATALKQAEDSTHLSAMANVLKDVTQQIEQSATTQLQATDAIVLSIEEIQDMVQRNAKIAHDLANSSAELGTLESNLAENMGSFLISSPPLPADFDETRPTIVYLFPGAPFFYGDIHKGIQGVFAPLRFQTMDMDTENDAILQAEYAQWILRQKWLKGIVLSAFDEQTGGRILLNAQKAKVPVIVADRTVDHATIAVLSNNKQGGEYAAEILREKLVGPQTVLACGPRNIHSMFHRMEGFFSKARSYGWKVGEVFTSMMNIEEAKQSILEGLRTNTGTSGLFLTNEHASMAYLQLLQDGGLAPYKLNAISYDINQDIAQAIYDGRLLGTIFQDPEQIGRIAAQELLKLIQQPDQQVVVTPQEVLVPVKKITRQNVDQYWSLRENNKHLHA